MQRSKERHSRTDAAFPRTSSGIAAKPSVDKLSVFIHSLEPLVPEACVQSEGDSRFLCDAKRGHLQIGPVLQATYSKRREVTQI